MFGIPNVLSDYALTHYQKSQIQKIAKIGEQNMESG